MINPDSIEALKSQLDIVDVVGNYIELKKSGANFKAICPFHDEKTPSFVVSPAKQIYHCFSCGAGGDSLKFVMEYEKLSYPEAIEKLASNYNFSLSYTSGKKQSDNSKILEDLHAFYKKELATNRVAMEYLKSRGISQASIERFGIAYAPSSQATLSFLRSSFVSAKDALDVGVMASGEGGYYARFIERIIFPIALPTGKIVGFGGRTLSGNMAKYLNSPQTKLFNKSRLLYAYDLASKSIYKKRSIIIAEGYIDVIMLHQAGFDNTVATLGTALTPDHLPLLRKGSPSVIMAYDSDKAGLDAAMKASRLLASHNFSGGVAIFKSGYDPADMVSSGLSDELREIFSAPKPFASFVLDGIISSYNLRDPLQKESAFGESMEFLKTLSPIVGEEYKKDLISKLGIDPSLVRLTNTFVSRNTNTAPNRDTLELTLIKTVLEKEAFAETILDVIEPSMMMFHASQMQKALSSRSEDSELVGILIDDDIKSIDTQDELVRELANFLSRHYERELKKLTMRTDLPFEKKVYEIRRYKDLIVRLKKGELVIV